jgi:hypothetical protein
MRPAPSQSSSDRSEAVEQYRSSRQHSAGDSHPNARLSVRRRDGGPGQEHPSHDDATSGPAGDHTETNSEESLKRLVTALARQAVAEAVAK